jgi:ketosteroid isomerase-like protein
MEGSTPCRDTAWDVGGEREIVKRAIDRWNRGERHPDEEVHPDVEIVSRLMGGGPLHGREGARSYLQEIDEHFDEWTVVGDEWHDAGDRVVMVGQIHLHGRESGITLDQRVGFLFEVRDRQLFRFETFIDDPADALEAAGLGN